MYLLPLGIHFVYDVIILNLTLTKLQLRYLKKGMSLINDIKNNAKITEALTVPVYMTMISTVRITCDYGTHEKSSFTT